MKKRYEALLVLNVRGTEESTKDVIDRLEAEFKNEGAEVDQIQKMDKREFSYAAGPLEAGYFVNFIFNSEPNVIEKLRSKFRLDNEVYRQHYQKLSPKKVALKV